MPARIEDYALVGDMQTAALVSTTGSVDWLSCPRFDSAAFFAALLGGEDNGHWTLAPRGATGAATRRGYRGDSLVLETEWDTPEGTVRVIDFMPPRDVQPDLVRIVEGVSGRVAMRSLLRLRFDYGHGIPWVRQVDGQVVGICGPDAVWLKSDVASYGRDFATYSDFEIGAGERVRFVLTWHPSHLAPPDPVDPDRSLERTTRFWTDWAARYDAHQPGGPGSSGEPGSSPWRDAVVRSLITLKGLTYEPTGGIVAAATTSLPEQLGGSRNWDYRYCWLRDSTMTLSALLRCGYTAEAAAWREWLLRAIAGAPDDLQIMYGVAGERRLLEYEVGWLPGYEGARPVRIGNAAAQQLQLDVYGEVMDSLAMARDEGMEPEHDAWELQLALVEHLADHWKEPDEGIWEIRGPRQEFTHSKVMAWVAMDRAVAGIERLGLEGPLDRWKEVRARIHREVCERAYDADRQTFTQAYGSADLDAALLLIPQVGFLPADDPRVVGTVTAVQRELTHDGFVQRYQTRGAGSVDGLAGGEGTFLACSFWLVDGLYLTGREREARELFDRLLGLRNDVGLLAEEYDAAARRQVGNFPQAYSHIALINSAFHLSGRHSPVSARHSPAARHSPGAPRGSG